MSRTVTNIKNNISPGFIVFLLLLLAHAFFITRGIGHVLLDRHEFRQTQTAISTFYIARDGNKLNYITPVLGSPWTIPFEFPLYQWIVAFFHNVTHVSLDESGRLVSIGFFYLCLPIVYQILRLLGVEKKNVWYVLCFILLNTTLLFWSRTFMIESTALFFSLVYVACILMGLKLFTERRLGVLFFLLVAMLSGTLAALVKVTTFTVYMIAAGLILLNTLLRFYKQKEWSRVIRLISSFWGVILLPVIAVYLWTLHSDHKKSLSYIGSFYSSAALSKWNFGTLEQRISPDKLLKTVSNACYVPFGALMVVLLTVWLPLKYRKLILGLAIPYYAIFFIFTNLYYVHDYYCYANAIIFSVMAGLFFASVLVLPGTSEKIMLSGFSLLLAVGSIYYYFDRYYKLQIKDRTDLTACAKSIKMITGKDDILMVIGTDWSSEIPYYTQRKAICLPENIVDSLSCNKQDVSVSVNHMLDKLNARIDDLVLIQNDVTDRDRKIAAYYHLNPEPVTLKYGWQNCFVFLGRR